MHPPLHCWVYKSGRQDEMYLYLAAEDGFSDLPEELLHGFGQPTLVMELDLYPGRKLASEPVGKVIENLHTQGYHLQLPPDIRPRLYRSK